MPVTLGNLAIIVAALVAAFVLILLGVRLARWRRDLALRQHGTPVLVMPINTGATPPRSLVVNEGRPVRSSPSSVRRVMTPLPRPIDPVIEDDVILVSNESLAQRATTPMDLVPEVEFEEDDRPGMTPLVRGGHIRYYQAEEGTLEFLPGRLEIVAGGEVGQEIHFLRQVGEDDATITFGRSEGPPLRHVQLLDPTVSRNHARLAYTAGRWHLTNLSHTNPVTLNGAPLPPSGRPMTLSEGDRVEMGAVVFIFHDR